MAEEGQQVVGRIAFGMLSYFFCAAVLVLVALLFVLLLMLAILVL